MFHANTKAEQKAKIAAEFTNLNKQTVEKASNRFQNCRMTVVEANGYFFE